jgi:hypothetical protein
VSLREPRRNLQIQSTAPLNVSGSHFRTRRAKPQRPLCPDETCMEVTALKDQAETCRHFADRTIAERGVRYGRVATTPTSAKTKRHPKAYLAIETPVVACPFRVKPGLPPWGPHVRFRREQTLVREGSPLVKLRNSCAACRR